MWIVELIESSTTTTAWPLTEENLEESMMSAMRRSEKSSEQSSEKCMLGPQHEKRRVGEPNPSIHLFMRDHGPFAFWKGHWFSPKL